jgi:acyl-coenzyme A synthetase/AMP-(fatty) acid ligase
MSYVDVLHIYGVSRAGFIPQLFSLRLPSPEVIFELSRKANAEALIFDVSFEPVLHHSPVPVFRATNVTEVDMVNEYLPEIPPVSNGDDTAFVFHTSGSTSGSPKLIPCSYAWLNTIIDKASQTNGPKVQGRQDVTVWMGSMCHIGQTFSQ